MCIRDSSRRGRSGSKTRAPKSYERPTTSSMNRVVIGDDMAGGGSASSPTSGTFTVGVARSSAAVLLSLIHISEPTRLLSISYAVFCLKKKKHKNIILSSLIQIDT
eukprot:TRINITY_DN25634_c0_g1_i1.p1 TRINITY_DN25634_c0_g1~~TRINITY_DN25634_c0_g1_i1.p1  ORF type:complete len:106 (-),score=25.51 TRINITY_DN25634_c0_g1_i1:29-346(-)